MNLKPLYIFDDAIEIARKNNILIELLFGYCKSRGEEDFCETDIILEILTMIRSNQTEFFKEMHASDDKFCEFLIKNELLK